MEGKSPVTLYETIFIVHPDQGGKVKEFTDRFKKIIEGLDGAVSQVDEWGLRDLAYRIKKQTKGYYTLFQYRSSARAVEELERNMKLTDGVLRYLTVRLDEETVSQPIQKGLPEETRRSSEEDLAKTNPQS
ncbi:MAG: 30S ribosomal protein S6 [Candidatus Binatia bacterium]